jgi:hypothetical protein
MATRTTDQRDEKDQRDQTEQERREREGDNPTQESDTSSVAPNVVLPDDPFSEEDHKMLALSLSRLGPFFLGNDVRSEESSLRVAKEVLFAFVEMGYNVPTLTADSKKNVKEYLEQSSYDVPTTEARTRHTPQTGSTPSGTSSTWGALEDDPNPTFGTGTGASTTSRTDPSNRPKQDDKENRENDKENDESTSSSGRSRTSASSGETSKNP